MTSTRIAAYTDLEAVLLFQALRAEGVHSISFNRISDQLNSIPLVRSDPSYDSGRLSPDALRELYLGLLKDEVRRGLERQQNSDSIITNGDASPGSRKRKVASPNLPTVHEAAQHWHLIPQLVERLYASYREKTVIKIQGYESRYAEAKREIAEIEAGQWDESLLRTKPSPKPSSTAHTLPVFTRNDNVQPVLASPSLVVAKQPTENGTQAPPNRYSQAKIDAVINHGPEPQDSPGGHRRASSNTRLPPLSEMATQSPRFGIPARIPGPSPHQPMQQLPPHAQNHAYNQTPSTGHQSPYATHHAHPRQGSMNNPQVQQSLSRPSSSPRPILPPPPGMSLPPPSPVPHLGSPRSAQYATPLATQQDYQPPPQHRHVQPAPPHPSGYPVTPMHQHPLQGYYQQQPYQDRTTSYPAQHPQTPTYPSHPPIHGQQPYMQPHPGQGQQGMYMQPFQVVPQDPNRPLAPQQHRIPQSPMPVLAATPYASHVYNGPSTGPKPPPQQARLVSDIITALATPPRPKVKQLWKEKYRPSPVMAGSETPRPVPEPLSPTLERARSPARSTRSIRSRDAPAVEEPLNAKKPASKKRKGRRKGNKRDRSSHSVASSTADESRCARSTRSHSVSPAAGAYPPSDDRPSSRNSVKAEPSTPANMLEDAESMQGPSAPSTTGIITRNRRGMIQSQSAPANSKRKRQESPAAPASHAAEGEPVSTPPPRSNVVIATRNFAKMSSAVMNDILSHKHAAYFNAPVRDKDAPGYSGIVLQPQNLKAIRSAITAGTHAVRAASAAIEDPSEAQTSTGTIELQCTMDIIPPKAIVNGAQLEKELYRMFANAYMFNPGEDGMALSTKEMFEDVEPKMSEWRGTERLAGVEDEEDGKGKRRKV